MVLAILLSLYFENMESYQHQLEDFAENVPIYCQITNKNGSRETGLFISDSVVQGLQASDLVKDETCMVWLMAGEGDFSSKDWTKINLYVDGANRVEAVPGLTEDQVKLEEGSVEEFFSSDQLQCMVSEPVMEERGWKIGDEILLNFFYFLGDNATMTLSCYTNPLELTEVKIVGTMEDVKASTAAVSPDLVFPFEAIRAMYQRNGIPFFADTVSFTVKDPRRLNEFKAEMKELGLVEKDLAAMDSYNGTALAVKDGSFISMASDLRQIMESMKAFLPVVLLVVLVIGYVVSSLLSGSRMEEYLLLRLQGIGRWRSAFSFWLEQILLVFVGIAVGDVFGILLSLKCSTLILINGVLLAAYMTGAAVAYGRMGRGKVLQLLA